MKYGHFMKKIIVPMCLVLAVVSGQALATQPLVMEIRNHAHAACIDVPDGNWRNELIVWACNDGGNQKFYLRKRGTDAEGLDVFEIRFGTRCVAPLSNRPRQWATDAHAIESELKLVPCEDRGTAFRFDNNFPGNVNPNAGLLRPLDGLQFCIDIANNAVFVVGKLHLWTCHGGPNQRWWAQKHDKVR